MIRRAMDDAFLIVVIGVSLLALAGAILALAATGSAYDRIGRGGLSIDEDSPSPDDDVEELRQLLAARSARRVARGEPPLDVEAEVSKRLRDE